MKILIFDTETIGLPKDYKASYEDVDNWPRVMSLAWTLFNVMYRDGNIELSIISEQGHMITPDGWVVPEDKFWINNGYSTKRSLLEGKPIMQVLDLFMEDIQKTELISGHNLSFDHRITWAELIRAGRVPRSGLPKICTMMKSTGHCKIPAKNGRGYKWPKLEELFYILFNKPMENAHDSLADVKATRDCFMELLRLKLIELPSTEVMASPSA